MSSQLTAPPQPRIEIDEPGASEESWLHEIERAALGRVRPGRPGRVAVLSPHPDDETLAVGGLLHDLVRGGWRVSLASVTDGEAAYSEASTLAALRRTELETALDRLGLLAATTVHRLAFPDARVRTHAAELESRLAPIVADADWVLAPWPSDGHPDHDATGRAGGRVARSLGKRISFFPVWAWHRLEPTAPEARMLLGGAERWDMSPAGLAAKRHAVDAFATQRDGRLGAPILPPHVLERFLRPFEIVLRCRP